MKHTKLITLRAWAEARFDPPPAEKTVQRWAHGLFTLASAAGRCTMVATEEAAVPASLTPRAAISDSSAIEALFSTQSV